MSPLSVDGNRYSVAPSALTRQPPRSLVKGMAARARWALVRLHDRTRFADVGRGSRNAIVTFHGVGVDPQVGVGENVTTACFRRILESVGQHADFVPLSEVTKQCSHQLVAVTFDDGFRCVYEDALPVLRDLDVPATVFLNPGLLDDRDPEQVAARHGTTTGEGLTLTDAQVRDLVADPLVSIGNHTSTHVDLTAVGDPAERRAEIVESAHLLEDRYGADVDSFAYPYGAYDDASRRLVERTHDVSVTTSPLLISGQRRPHNLPRVNGTAPLPRLSWELTPMSDLLHRLRRPLRDTATGPRDPG